VDGFERKFMLKLVKTLLFLSPHLTCKGMVVGTESVIMRASINKVGR
jgi:hypothetical protein